MAYDSEDEEDEIVPDGGRVSVSYTMRDAAGLKAGDRLRDMDTGRVTILDAALAAALHAEAAKSRLPVDTLCRAKFRWQIEDGMPGAALGGAGGDMPRPRSRQPDGRETMTDGGLSDAERAFAETPEGRAHLARERRNFDMRGPNNTMNWGEQHERMAIREGAALAARREVTRASLGNGEADLAALRGQRRALGIMRKERLNGRA